MFYLYYDIYIYIESQTFLKGKSQNCRKQVFPQNRLVIIWGIGIMRRILSPLKIPSPRITQNYTFGPTPQPPPLHFMFNGYSTEV